MNTPIQRPSEQGLDSQHKTVRARAGVRNDKSRPNVAANEKIANKLATHPLLKQT